MRARPAVAAVRRVSGRAVSYDTAAPIVDAGARKLKRLLFHINLKLREREKVIALHRPLSVTLAAPVTAFLIVSSTAWAQQPAAAPSGRVDLTAIAIAAVGGVFSIISAVAVALINSHVKNATARQVLNAAVTNSIGALQMAAKEEITRAAPQFDLPPKLEAYRPAVQYVLDHAENEANRFGIKPADIADKINARLGLAHIAHNLAVTANATPEVKPPLSPVQEPIDS